MKQLITLCICLLLIAGCKKEETRKGDFTFYNELGKPVVIDIYATEQDYYNNTNIVYHGQVAGSGALKVPMTTFKENKEDYYIDWYSEDYRYTNWLAGGQMPHTITMGGSTKVGNAIPSDLRMLALNGNQAKTEWKATGSYPNDVTWQQLSEDEKNVSVTFTKARKAIYVSKRHAGEYSWYATNDYGNQIGIHLIYMVIALGSGIDDSTGMGIPRSLEKLVQYSVDEARFGKPFIIFQKQ